MASDGLGWPRMASDGLGWPRMASDGIERHAAHPIPVALSLFGLHAHAHHGAPLPHRSPDPCCPLSLWLPQIPPLHPCMRPCPYPSTLHFGPCFAWFCAVAVRSDLRRYSAKKCCAQVLLSAVAADATSVSALVLAASSAAPSASSSYSREKCMADSYSCIFLK